MPTETEKAQALADAITSFQAEVVQDQATITQLQAQIAAGQPITADQLGALNIVDTEFTALNPAAPTPTPAPASTPTQAASTPPAGS